MPWLKTLLGERVLEGKRAANQEADMVVRPLLQDIVLRRRVLPAAKDSVPGEVGADVEVGRRDASSWHDMMRVSHRRVS